MTDAAPTRRRSPRGQGALVREEFVSVAEQLLRERGSADAVPVAEIVRRVGVTAPVLYQHFADKDDLFVAVHLRRMHDFRDTLRRATRRGDSPLAALERRGRAYIRYAVDKQDAYIALFMTPSQVGEDVFDDPRKREVTAYDDLVANLVACMEAGEIPTSDPELAARVVWAQVHGLASLLIAMPTIERNVGRKALVDRLLAGVTATLVHPPDPARGR